MELIAATPGSRSNNLVFTSAGDRSNLRGWLHGRRDFDLWVVYYGAHPGTFQELANYHVNRRGAKFLNLHYCYRWPEVLARWALQPAFRLAGKVSWDIAAVHATAKLKVTCINPSKRLARRLAPRATPRQR